MLWLSARTAIVFFAAWKIVFGQVDEATIKTTVREVVVPVIVTDKSGKYVTDLDRNDFTVLESGVPQTIVAFDAWLWKPNNSRRRLDGSRSGKVLERLVQTRTTPAKLT